MLKETHTRDFERFSFQIMYQNSRACLVCLLMVFFLFINADATTKSKLSQDIGYTLPSEQYNTYQKIWSPKQEGFLSIYRFK